MLKKLTLLLIFTIVLSAGVNAQQIGVDPNVPDTLYVDSVVSTSATRGFVPIYFYNDEELAGMEITLTYDSPNVQIDSFSFAGGRLEGFTLKGADQLSSNTITCYSYSLSEGLVPPGNGLLGYLFFSYSSPIDAHVVSIDTSTLIVGEKEFATVFSDGNANMFKPEFVKGFLDIQPSFCCLGDRGNVDMDPEDLCDIGDILYMVEYQFNDGPPPVCLDEANVDGDLEGSIDIEDIIYMVEYQFNSGPAPGSCP